LGLILLAFIFGQVGGGLGIAAEKKWGYWLSLFCAVVPVAFTIFLVARYHSFGVNVLNFLFEVALLVALLHPMTRSYRKIWFR
ncbi:MAG: hypothetical protein ACRD0B_09035, partial [Acidimicrobiales bacterium]